MQNHKYKIILVKKIMTDTNKEGKCNIWHEQEMKQFEILQLNI